MADILEFTTTPAADAGAETPEELFTFRLDGVEVAARRPKDAVVAELGPISSRRTAPVQKLKIALDFLGDILVEPGRSHVQGRLLDPDDSLDAPKAMEILQAIGDHWKAQNAAAEGKAATGS